MYSCYCSSNSRIGGGWHRRLLRPRREWPRHRGAANERDELAPFHSIVLSALAALIEMALPAPSVLDQKDSTPQYDMRLLRCGISTRLMTAVGHSRPAGA